MELGYQIPIHKKGDTGDCDEYRGITRYKLFGKTVQQHPECQNNQICLEEAGTLTENGFTTKDNPCAHSK